MSQYTENYHLEKPESNDDFENFLGNYGSNMDIIDEHLGQGGGGGGNVDDVLVNGVSVVDGNHDARITSYKEVTQAEYDALPATKLTDGIAYFIKDAGGGGGGGGSSSHNYSTTEHVIGTWIDGKPLYEITINLGRLTFNSNWQSVNHNISDIKTIVDIKGILVSAVSPYYCYPIPAYRPSITQGIIVGGNATVIQYINNWQSDDHTAYVTIQYTKTTD